jgi:hypothetical protein
MTSAKIRTIGCGMMTAPTQRYELPLCSDMCPTTWSCRKAQRMTALNHLERQIDLLFVHCPKVIAHLDAETAYAKAALADTEALQEALYKELRGRIQVWPRLQGLYVEHA